MRRRSMPAMRCANGLEKEKSCDLRRPITRIGKSFPSIAEASVPLVSMAGITVTPLTSSKLNDFETSHPTRFWVSVVTSHGAQDSGEMSLSLALYAARHNAIKLLDELAESPGASALEALVRFIGRMFSHSPPLKDRTRCCRRPILFIFITVKCRGLCRTSTSILRFGRRIGRLSPDLGGVVSRRTIPLGPVFQINVCLKTPCDVLLICKIFSQRGSARVFTLALELKFKFLS